MIHSDALVLNRSVGDQMALSKRIKVISAQT
jgi:hypothetical protein